MVAVLRTLPGYSQRRTSERSRPRSIADHPTYRSAQSAYAPPMVSPFVSSTRRHYGLNQPPDYPTPNRPLAAPSGCGGRWRVRNETDPSRPAAGISSAEAKQPARELLDLVVQDRSQIGVDLAIGLQPLRTAIQELGPPC